MKFAICNELFAGWDFSAVASYVAGLGYDGLELAPYTLAASARAIGPARRREIRAIAADAGLAIVGLHWLLVKPEGLHLTSPQPDVRRRTIDYLKELTDLCRDLGGAVLVFGSPDQRRLPEGVHGEEARRWAVEGFRACAEAAAAGGVTVCLEALPAPLTNLLNTNAEVLAMLAEIGHPGAAMMLDVKSMYAEGIPIPANIRQCAGRFRHVHANDANLRGPGFGEVDFRPILGTLAELGYEGYVSVEVFDFTPDPETIARRSLAYMRSCLP